VRRWILAAALALPACHRSAETSPAAASAAPAPEPTTLPSARRPARRYYLERTAARCEIYSRDSDHRPGLRSDEPSSAPDPGGESPRVQTPCPLDLAVGESIRIAGKTCVRESADPARVVPVVCPDPLTNREKRDLAARAP
jgi:hypothetical protein